jgi:hypothetical protein
MELSSKNSYTLLDQDLQGKASKGVRGAGWSRLEGLHTCVIDCRLNNGIVGYVFENKSLGLEMWLHL